MKLSQVVRWSSLKAKAEVKQTDMRARGTISWNRGDSVALFLQTDVRTGGH